MVIGVGLSDGNDSDLRLYCVQKSLGRRILPAVMADLQYVGPQRFWAILRKDFVRGCPFYGRQSHGAFRNLTSVSMWKVCGNRSNKCISVIS